MTTLPIPLDGRCVPREAVSYRPFFGYRKPTIRRHQPHDRQT